MTNLPYTEISALERNGKCASANASNSSNTSAISQLVGFKIQLMINE